MSDKITEEESRKIFESEVLNNRVDDPVSGSIYKDAFGFYRDNRLNVGWWAWEKARIMFSEKE